MLITEKERKANALKAPLGGQATAKKMTKEEKIDRATAGGTKAGSNMTPEQRTERARNAANARHSGKNKASS